MTSKHQWLQRDFYLHLAIAIVIGIQLLSSLLFGLPGPWYFVHKLFGIIALFLILGFLWSRAVNPLPNKWANLFPWLTTQGRQHIAEDVRCLCQMKLPIRTAGGLAGMVQGLGILLILAMSALGTIWYILVFFKLASHDTTHLIMKCHKQLATLVWFYFIGHAAMAILHRILPASQQKDMETQA